MILLIAEDENDTLEYLEKKINWNSIGIVKVLTANNGRDALSLVLNEPVRILVTDIEMPIMNGLDLIKEINVQNVDVDCIVLTAFRNFEYAQKALKYSAVDYILKPIDPEELSRVVGEIANRRLHPPGEYTPKEILKAKQFMATNVLNTPTLDEICSAAGLSKNYFCSFFKKETGMSIWDFFTTLKIGKCKEYLHDFNLKVYEISLLLGYGNPSYLNKVFKAHEGITPNEYRKSLQKQMTFK